MRASVCIATYNRYGTLEHTLKSVLAADLTSVDEILIIDQTADLSSMQESLQLLLKDPLVTYIHETIPSLTKARNIGLHTAAKTSEIIVYIDDDVEISRDFFHTHIACYEDQSVHVVGGREIIVSGEEADNWGGAPPDIVRRDHGVKRAVNRLLRGPVMLLSSKRNRYMNNAVSPGLVLGGWLFVCIPSEAVYPCRMDTVRGCNMSFRVSTLKKVGGFDERYVGSARREESDVCFTIMDHIGKDAIMYQPKAVVLHHMAQTGGCRDVSRLHADHMRNEILFISKHIQNPVGRLLVSLSIRVKILLRG